MCQTCYSSHGWALKGCVEDVQRVERCGRVKSLHEKVEGNLDLEDAGAKVRLGDGMGESSHAQVFSDSLFFKAGFIFGHHLSSEMQVLLVFKK